jgi:hypothetical protein
MSEVMKLESVGGRRRSQRTQKRSSQRQQKRASQRRGGKRQQQQRRQKKQQGGEKLQPQQDGEQNEDEQVEAPVSGQAGGDKKPEILPVKDTFDTIAREVSNVTDKATNALSGVYAGGKQQKQQQGGSAVDAGAAAYQAGAPGYNSATQVHNTFGGIGQQVGTHGPAGIIQPVAPQGSGSQMGGKRSQRKQRKQQKSKKQH